MKVRVALAWIALLLGAACLPAGAVEVHVSAPALERTLKAQLFNVPGPAANGQPGKPERYYLKGSAGSACGSYADDPHVSFRHTEGEDDRIVVKLKTHSHFGTSLHGACLGLALNTDAEVSFIPVAEGETIGFRDARIEHLSENKELNFLLVPFLARKLPAEMKMNAASLLRTLLVHAPDQTGYTLTLTSLKLHSMVVEGQALLVDLDAVIKVD